MTPKVLDTLVYLAKNPARVIEKDELMGAVWPETTVEENNLSQNISILRRVFGERPGEHRFIDTIPGRGFQFLPEVTVIDTDSGDGAKQRAPKPEIVGEPESSAVFPRSRIFYLSFATLLVFLLAVAGFYVWNRRSPGDTLRQVGSVAILPFQPLVAEDRNPALEFGMTDTLIWKLSGSETKVFPFSSVRRFDSPDQDPILAGRDIGADAVIDGRVVAVDGRIRVSVQLIRVSDGIQLWAGQFDENSGDIFAVQDSISARVAAELKVRLDDNGKKRYTDNAEAYQLYLKGRFLSQKAQPQDIRTGIEYFEQALRLDSNYAPAYVGLADSYRALVLIDDTAPLEEMPKALAAANRAVAIDDSYAEAHAMLGWLTFWYDWNWKVAERAMKRAIDLDPASSDAHQFYAHLLSNTGRHDESLIEIRTALELEPLSLRANSFLGMFLFAAGHTDAAIAQFDKTLELNADYRLALMFSARTLITQGRFESAVAAAQKTVELSGGASDPRTVEAVALAMAGKPETAQRLVDRSKEGSDGRYISPYNTALLLNSLGDRDTALSFLERAHSEKDVRMVFLKVEPRWNNLRSMARFGALMRKMNFE